MPEITRQVDLRAGYYNAIKSLQEGTYKGSGDIIDWTLWDRLVMLNTTNRHVLFVNGIGGTFPGGALKDMADTNVEGNQGMPLGSKLYVRAIKLFYQFHAEPSEAIMQDFYDMLQETTFNISIYGKYSYGQWGLDELFGICVTGQPLAAVVAPGISQNRYVGIYPLNLPIVLASQVSFQVQVEHHAAAADTLNTDRIKVGLNGILERLS